MVESAKLFTMSQAEVDAGMVHHDKEVMDALHARGASTCLWREAT